MIYMVMCEQHHLLERGVSLSYWSVQGLPGPKGFSNTISPYLHGSLWKRCGDGTNGRKITKLILISPPCTEDGLCVNLHLQEVGLILYGYGREEPRYLLCPIKTAQGERGECCFASRPLEGATDHTIALNLQRV